MGGQRWVPGRSTAHRCRSSKVDPAPSDRARLECVPPPALADLVLVRTSTTWRGPGICQHADHVSRTWYLSARRPRGADLALLSTSTTWRGPGTSQYVDHVARTWYLSARNTWRGPGTCPHVDHVARTWYLSARRPRGADLVLVRTSTTWRGPGICQHADHVAGARGPG